MSEDNRSGEEKIVSKLCIIYKDKNWFTLSEKEKEIISDLEDLGWLSGYDHVIDTRG